jgi:DNA-directed RNA polymerase subunit M/transcription elongation factor TFIIS
MFDFCLSCGKELKTTSAANKKSARFICEECYAKSKEAKVTYRILYKNGIEDKIIQTANEEEIKVVNNLITHAFQEGETGVLTLGNRNKEGYIIRIDDISRIIINEGVF